uniref:Uncharacterized protein n=1 Tax=viral metagenome TaxID=1070528 RepID=A0A6C0EHJ8_9ZZZZ
MYTKITNPYTNRKVSLDTKQGKNILKQYLNGGAFIEKPKLGINYINLSNALILLAKTTRELDIEADILESSKDADIRTRGERLHQMPPKKITSKDLVAFNNSFQYIYMRLLKLIKLNGDNCSYVCIGNTPFKLFKIIELLRNEGEIDLPNITFRYLPFSGRAIDIRGTEKSDINNLLKFINYPNLKTTLGEESVIDMKQFDRELRKQGKTYRTQAISTENTVKKYSTAQLEVFESMINNCLGEDIKSGKKLIFIDFCDTCFGLMSFLHTLSQTQLFKADTPFETWIFNAGLVQDLITVPLLLNKNLKSYIDISQNSTFKITNYIKNGVLNNDREGAPVIDAKVLGKIDAKLINISSMNYILLGSEELGLKDRCVLKYKPEDWTTSWSNCYEKNYLINGYVEFDNERAYPALDNLYNNNQCVKMILFLYNNLYHRIQYENKYNKGTNPYT